VLRLDVGAVRRHLETEWHLCAASEHGLLHLSPRADVPAHVVADQPADHPWRAAVAQAR